MLHKMDSAENGTPKSVKRLSELTSLVEAKLAGAMGDTSETLTMGFRKITPHSPLNNSFLTHPLVDLMIILSVLQVGLQVDLRGSEWNRIWLASDCVFALFFFGELLLLLTTSGRQCLRSFLHVIDCVATCCLIIDIILRSTIQQDAMTLRLVRILRLLRLIRIFQMLRLFSEVRVLMEGFFASMRAVMWLILFMGLVIYVGSILCVTVVGSKDVGYPAFNSEAEIIKNSQLEHFNNFKFFGSVWRSMLTLFFIMMASDEMTGVLRATSHIQPWVTVCLLLFVLVMSLCFVNLIIGVIVEKTVAAVIEKENSQWESKKRQLRAVEKLASIMFALDTDTSNELSIDE